MKDIKDGVEVKSSDSCHRCGQRRRTRELELEGTVIRLCDDCYWGRESTPNTDRTSA
jgi:ribosome-binding protein aMBF1 (putative translation factor)